MRTIRNLVIAFALVFALASREIFADVVTLKSGKTVEGVVIKFGSDYRVKLADGQIQVIPERDVAAISKGSASSPASGAAAGDVPAPAVAPSSANFQSVKYRADAVDTPLLAVTIWEKYLESNPSSSDAAAAKVELAKWQKLADDRAERINGKWVGGEARRKLLHDVQKLCAEAREQLDSHTLEAIGLYEKALALYPNSFEANFALGFFYLQKGAPTANSKGNLAEMDKAIRSLEAAVRLRPDSAAALSNLAVGYSLRQRYDESVTAAYKAARLGDSKPIVENLVNCIAAAPPGLRTSNRRLQPVIQEASLLARKYQIDPKGTGRFAYLVPEAPPPDEAGITEAGAPGVVGNGSGFLVTSDGYIITNKHVVDEKNRIFRVRFDDGTEKPAEVVAVDPRMDIGLIKIKADKPMPYLKIAEKPRANAGAICMVLGYPVASLLDYQMQVTSGEITAASEIDDYQLTLTANTTHGNSGGPIVDKDGNVIGILSAATEAFNATYLKAISAGQIRTFIEGIKSKFPAGVETGASTDTRFDGEKLAADARKATVMVLIIRGDGKEIE